MPNFKAAEKVEAVRNGFTSRRAFINLITVSETALDEHGHPDSSKTWSNEDLDPTPPEKRTWRWWNFVTFYLGIAMGNWTRNALRFYRLSCNN